MSLYKQVPAERLSGLNSKFAASKKKIVKYLA